MTSKEENSKNYKYPFTAKEKHKILTACNTSSVRFVSRRYHVSINTIYWWKKQYDGTLESLENKSHAKHTPNKNCQTEEETKYIDDIVKRNPNIGLNELYGKLKQKYNYSRNISTLYRYLVKTGFYKQREKKKKHVSKKYDTPTVIGEKMQLDVKVVPNSCKGSNDLFDKNFYQYTIIDEATRERYIYCYEEQSAASTVDFVKRAIKYFGYIPKMIQTDNGNEFTYIRETTKEHPFDTLCKQLNIEHKKIKPATPRHNGKVERSHRNDQERFYNDLKFYSLEDLNKQLAAYLKRSNNIPSRVLNWKTPLEKRKELEDEENKKNK